MYKQNNKPWKQVLILQSANVSFANKSTTLLNLILSDWIFESHSESEDDEHTCKRKVLKMNVYCAEIMQHC